MGWPGCEARRRSRTPRLGPGSVPGRSSSLIGSAAGSSAFALSDGPEAGESLCSEPSGDRALGLCRLSPPGWCGEVPGRRAGLPDSALQALPAEPETTGVPGPRRRVPGPQPARVSWRDLAFISALCQPGGGPRVLKHGPRARPSARGPPGPHQPILAPLCLSLLWPVCASLSLCSALSPLSTCPCPPVSSQVSPPWEASPDLSWCLRAPTLRALLQGGHSSCPSEWLPSQAERTARRTARRTGSPRGLVSLASPALSLREATVGAPGENTGCWPGRGVLCAVWPPGGSWAPGPFRALSEGRGWQPGRAPPPLPPWPRRQAAGPGGGCSPEKEILEKLKQARLEIHWIPTGPDLPCSTSNISGRKTNRLRERQCLPVPRRSLRGGLAARSPSRRGEPASPRAADSAVPAAATPLLPPYPLRPPRPCRLLLPLAARTVPPGPWHRRGSRQQARSSSSTPTRLRGLLPLAEPSPSPAQEPQPPTRPLAFASACCQG